MPEQESNRGVANIPSCFGAFDPSITARSAWGAQSKQTANRLGDRRFRRGAASRVAKWYRLLRCAPSGRGALAKVSAAAGEEEDVRWCRAASAAAVELVLRHCLGVESETRSGPAGDRRML